MVAKKKAKKKKKVDLCDKYGKDHSKVKPHTCPYAFEIEDDKRLCNCCDECEQDCADDI
jgi:hypothetical protein